LKLENILIDKDGYCKVCDLGFAKVVVDKTFTLVGTPEYLAPEVIISKGHNMAVDYWSFGVLCFELHMGVSPFYKRRSTQIEMFKRIILGQYTLPGHTSPTCNEFIQGLLTRSPMKRLGNLSRGYLDIKNHAWYEESGINFTEILRKEFEAPWKPVVKDPLELSDFGDFESLETDSTPDIPLSAEEQELFAEFSKV
jgi:serine/threonine protein kinase